MKEETVLHEGKADRPIRIRQRVADVLADNDKRRPGRSLADKVDYFRNRH